MTESYLKKRITLLIASVFLIIFGTGCATKAGKPTPPQTGVMLMTVAESESGSLDTKSSLQLSEEQLRSAKMGLEAFRLFSGHFKIQADPKTLNSIKTPAMDYIQQYIDPILNRRHQLQDDDYSQLIVTIYYLKAYLYWVFDDVRPAREMVAQLKENLPEKLRKKTISHFDQGEVTIEEALQELEQLIANRLEGSNGLKTD